MNELAMKLVRIALLPALLAIGILIGFGYGRWYGPRQSAENSKQANKPKGYHCPMHPSYHSDKPGDCPICGMKLVPDEDLLIRSTRRRRSQLARFSSTGIQRLPISSPTSLASTPKPGATWNRSTRTIRQRCRWAPSALVPKSSR